MSGLARDGARRGASAKLDADITTLAACWPDFKNVDVRSLKGWGPLRELRRLHNGIAYRIFFVTHGRELWLLSAFEKKSERTPRAELERAYARMQAIFRGAHEPDNP